MRSTAVNNQRVYFVQNLVPPLLSAVISLGNITYEAFRRISLLVLTPFIQ